MDTISHGLWSYAIFRRQKRWWVAPLIGVLPDLTTFGPHLILEHFQGRQVLFDWLYCYTHSLVLWAIVMFVVSVFAKRILWVGCAWALHIVIDIFTHPLSYYPTPYLYPFHSPFIMAVDYRSVGFMVINYLVVSVVFAILFRLRFRKEL